MLVFQDPSNPNSTYLLESILDACSEAQKVTAAFAYATAAGVRLMTQGSAFQNLIENHEVDLVVGVDGVTNVGALNALQEVSSNHERFQVRVFLNPRNDVIFHPKVCWTKGDSGGVVIVGSGNLTEAGLLGNWEAYSYEELDKGGLHEVEMTWSNWVDRHSDWLRPLSDADVRTRAAANTVMARQGDLPTLQSVPTQQVEGVQGSVHPLDESHVLIAEIPRSGNRWKQANFKKNDYENFFGAEVGQQRLVVFRFVKADGTLSPYEHSRPSVEVKSQNYRFELDAAAGLPYPDEGRPIGVFVRVATRTFLYHLLMPGDQEYHSVVAILDATGDDSTVRRNRTTGAELRKNWPAAPFWNLTD